MLLKITDKCYMGCSHCSENCTPNGEHMSMETFQETLKFLSRINPLIIIVTGGEPTCHPEFLTMIKMLKKRYKKEQICITSNGMFLEDEEYTAKILGLGVVVQITNDERFYPKRIPYVKHPLLIYENHIRHVYPMGRAVTNGLEIYGTKAPKCFNTRSIARRNVSSLPEMVRALEMMGKFCTPSISIKGDIQTGEFNGCTPVGTIKDNQTTILNNIRNLKCDNCGMEAVLTAEQLSIIK